MGRIKRRDCVKEWLKNYCKERGKVVVGKKTGLFTIYFDGELSSAEMVNIANKIRDLLESNNLMEKSEIENLRTGTLFCW